MRPRLFFTALIALMTISHVLHAQPQPPLPQQFGIWSYDSTFYIGVSGINNPHKAVETYHMKFQQIYGQDIRALQTLIAKDYHTLVDANGNWPTGGGYGDGPTNYKDSLRKKFFLQSDTVGLKLILAPLDVQTLVGDAVVNEHYYATTPAMTNYDFREPRATPNSDLDSVGESIDFTKGDLITGTTVLAGDTVFIAGDPRYTFRVLKQSGAGWYAHLGMADGSTFFDVAIALTAYNIPGIMDSNAVLAYADLFVRDTLGQTDSIGAIYRKIGRFDITKAKYLTATTDSLRSAGAGFFEVVEPVDLSVAKYRLPLVTSSVHGWQWDTGDRKLRAASTDSARMAERVAISDTTNALWLPPGSFSRRTWDPGSNKYVVEPVEGSEFIIRFYTTGLVDISYQFFDIIPH